MKEKKAVALKYDIGQVAPEVLGKGKGFVADRMLDKALNNEIPIYENKELVEELLNIDIGSNIPEELYEVVAEILVFINALDKSKNKYE